MAYYPLPDRNQMEKYIGEQIAELVEDLSISSKYVVYVLECGRDIPPEQRMTVLEQFMEESDEYSKPTRPKDPKTIKPEEERERIGVAPAWWHHSCRADELYYVGYTDNLGRRLFDHILGTDDGALFTKVFEPNALLSIREYSTQKLALKREKQIASTLSDSGGYHRGRTDYNDLPISKKQQQNKWDRYYGTALQEGYNNIEEVKDEKQKILNKFSESEYHQLTKYILDQQIKYINNEIKKVRSFEYSDSRKKSDIIYHKIVKRHLKNCKKLLEENRIGDDPTLKNDIDNSVERVRDFYRGAYLDYRGLIRRMNSEKLVFVYQL